MKLKTVEDHYDATKPIGWCRYAEVGDQWRGFAERLVESVRHEIAKALREALDCDAGETIESLISYAASVNDSVNVLRGRIAILEAAQKPAEVAVDENEDVRNGRVEYMLFSGAKSDQAWLLLSATTRKRWIDYARTLRRPKVSPGQRLFEAMNKAYGWGILWSDCPVQQKLEAAAKSLGITECDA